MRASVLILSLLLAANGFAAEVLRVGKDLVNIAVTHDDFRKWRIEDRVCVFQFDGQQERRLICGSVIKTTPKGAIVHLEDKNVDVAAGNVVRIASNGADPTLSTNAAPPRRPAATMMSTVAGDRTSRPYKFNVGGGGGITASAPFPFPQFQLTAQFAIKPKVAVGVSPILFVAPSPSGNSQLLGVGGFATVSYYRNEYFRGLWLQGGAGMASLVASDSLGTVPESSTVLGAMGTVGWRGSWEMGMNVGIAVGAEYFGTPTFTNYVAGSIGILPIVLLDIGFNF